MQHSFKPALVTFVLFVVREMHAQNVPGRPLVILAATRRDDPYYGEFFETISDFQVRFVMSR